MQKANAQEPRQVDQRAGRTSEVVVYRVSKVEGGIRHHQFAKGHIQGQESYKRLCQDKAPRMV